MCLINFPRSYLFELSETVIDTQESSELFDDDGDPQNLLKKMGEITKIQAKYSWFSANGVQTGNLDTLFNPQVCICKTKKKSDRERERDFSKEDIQTAQNTNKKTFFLSMWPRYIPYVLSVDMIPEYVSAIGKE